MLYGNSSLSWSSVKVLASLYPWNRPKTKVLCASVKYTRVIYLGNKKKFDNTSHAVLRRCVSCKPPSTVFNSIYGRTWSEGGGNWSYVMWREPFLTNYFYYFISRLIPTWFTTSKIAGYIKTRAQSMKVEGARCTAVVYGGYDTKVLFLSKVKLESSLWSRKSWKSCGSRAVVSVGRLQNGATTLATEKYMSVILTVYCMKDYHKKSLKVTEIFKK